ncbi:MAG: class I SAM-dependent methyltransferase [Candidatus Hodarchaeota archaeon]
MPTAFGTSLLAYWNGETSVTHIIERDDGYKEETLVEYLFKQKNDWPKEEVYTLEHIPTNSNVLDIGCGAARVGMVLQTEGHQVVGVDSCPEAIQISKARGLHFTYLRDICQLETPPILDQFDSIIMMGNNFGICGDIPETEKLLTRLSSFLTDTGLLIFSCRDPLKTNKAIHLAYHSKNRELGRPPGLIRLRVVYQDLKDPWWDLLFVGVQTAEKILENTGFQRIALYQDASSAIYYIVARKLESIK